MAEVLNFNIGVLGHIDSGKTTLAKALSVVASTASFDKNPQSQERGITIDLGFSSFSVPFPDHLKTVESNFKTLQYTLVDCPGHASLIRTIIGGAQIIDLMLLVIDATKGIQTQTAECLVIGEITCEHLIIVINKIDLVPEANRQLTLDKMKKKISKTLEKTKFLNAPMVCVAANPGGSGDSPKESIGIKELVDTLTQLSYVPPRTSDGPFIFAVDHCFAIKGQGSVMTGTVIQGGISLNDSIEIPSAKLIKKVKSIQMFKKPVTKAIQGDRVGICVTQFDSSLLERGIVCAPGHCRFIDAIVAEVDRIPYFKNPCNSGSKFHITIMHDTVIAKCTFFGAVKSVDTLQNVNFSLQDDYIFLNELKTMDAETDIKCTKQFALLEFERCITICQDAALIGSKLDMDIHSNSCRLVFSGKVKLAFTKTDLTAQLPNLKVYKMKTKEGLVDRMTNEHEIICKDLFKKETKMQLFSNLKVRLSTGEDGVIMGSFGQSGKAKVHIPSGLNSETVSRLGKKKKGEKDSIVNVSDPVKVILTFKRYIYDDKKRIIQN